MRNTKWYVGLFAVFLIVFFYGLNAQYPLLGQDYFCTSWRVIFTYDIVDA